MNTLFDRIEILNISFENSNQEVRINCNVCQGLECIESTLLINFTDLNRILGRLSTMGVEIDFSAFEVTRVNYEETHYALNTAQMFHEPLAIDNFEMLHPYRQICA
jgi:hypothetical protein